MRLLLFSGKARSLLAQLLEGTSARMVKSFAERQRERDRGRGQTPGPNFGLWRERRHLWGPHTEHALKIKAAGLEIHSRKLIGRCCSLFQRQKTQSTKQTLSVQVAMDIAVDIRGKYGQNLRQNPHRTCQSERCYQII